MASLKKEIFDAGVSPLRRRGQHFLIEEGVARKIVDAASLTKRDTVVEVGPGLGVLTKKLTERVKRVIAIELDKELCAYLEKKFFNVHNLTLIHDDALSFNSKNCELRTTNYCVVSNLPYNITSRAIRMFLEQERKPSHMVLMMQREVAERLCARKPPFSLLSLSVRFFASARILFMVQPTCFFPSPRVQSAVVRIDVVKRRSSREEERLFFLLLHAGFASKRKKLFSLLKKISPSLIILHKAFQELGFSQHIRAEELDSRAWRALAEKLFSTGRTSV